jgi:hypothetical protein
LAQNSSGAAGYVKKHSMSLMQGDSPPKKKSLKEIPEVVVKSSPKIAVKDVAEVSDYYDTSFTQHSRHISHINMNSKHLENKLLKITDPY